MEFKLPDFTDTYCHAVAACGSIKSKSQKVLEALQGGPKTVCARYKTSHDHPRILVILGGREDKRHFHMEVMSEFLAKKREFHPRERPIEEVQELIRPMISRQITVLVSGLFVLPIDRLPRDSIVQVTSKKEGKHTFKTTRVEFEVVQGDVARISWRLAEEGMVRVDLTTFMVGKIEEVYLVEFFRTLNSAFSRYVLGGDSR
jgi:hypothetical protein